MAAYTPLVYSSLSTNDLTPFRLKNNWKTNKKNVYIMYISIVQLVIQRDVMVIVNVFGPEVLVE